MVTEIVVAFAADAVNGKNALRSRNAVNRGLVMSSPLMGRQLTRFRYFPGFTRRRNESSMIAWSTDP